MKIGIVGNGVVGHATARCFMEHADVRVNDLRREKSTHSITEVLECDLVFVCLPSPMKEDKSGCNTHAIEAFFSDCYINYHDVNFVLKSTVPIGFTRRMAEKYQLKNLVHSPEFLTARCAVTDAQLPARNIIGSNNRTWMGICERMLRDLYEQRFSGIPIHIMTSEESEAIKLIQNSFFATKIAFFNEMYSLCQKLGMDWQTVLGGVLSDGRIAHSHTQVPGPDGKLGFGGACLIGSTQIKTPSGWKYLRDISLGDKICSLTGITTVKEKKVRIVENTYKMRVRGREIVGSEDHIHFIVNNQDELVETQFKDVKKGDWVFYPWAELNCKKSGILLGEKRKYTKEWKNFVKWTPDLAWAIGLWLAEGFRGVYPSQGRTGVNTVWTLGEHENLLADKLVEVLGKIGVITKKTLKVSDGTFGVSRTWQIRNRGIFLYKLLEEIKVGSECYNKRMPLDCPYPQQLIGGWLDGDGSIYKGAISGHSESIEMIADIDRILSSLEICANVSDNGRKIIISNRDDVERVCSWTQRIKVKERHYRRSFSYKSPTVRKFNGGVILKVQSIGKLGKAEVIGIDTEDHTYIANGILTHNCLPKDLNNLVQCFHDNLVVFPYILETVQIRNGLDRKEE